MTIRLGVGTFLLVLRCNHVTLHGYGDTGPQRFWDHDLDLLGSRDVIGYVTIGLGICGFLLVVHCNHASILLLVYVVGQQFTAHAPCHVTCERGVQNDHIFGIPEAILPIHYDIFMELRRRFRAV